MRLPPAEPDSLMLTSELAEINGIGCKRSQPIPNYKPRVATKTQTAVQQWPATRYDQLAREPSYIAQNELSLWTGSPKA